MASSSSVTNKTTGLIFVLVTILIWTRAAAQPEYCNNAIISLELPCLIYVTGNSESPSSSCCSSLAGVVETQPECLCALINIGGSYNGSIPNINRQRVLGLPATCNVQTPPANLCNGGTTPYN